MADQNARDCNGSPLYALGRCKDDGAVSVTCIDCVRCADGHIKMLGRQNDREQLVVVNMPPEDLLDFWKMLGTMLGVYPIRQRIICEACGELHVDEGAFEKKIHHTHACQNCGAVFRPAIVDTVGVRFLPGFKNEER